MTVKWLSSEHIYDAARKVCHGVKEHVHNLYDWGERLTARASACRAFSSFQRNAPDRALKKICAGCAPLVHCACLSRATSKERAYRGSSALLGQSILALLMCRDVLKLQASQSRHITCSNSKVCPVNSLSMS